jgi:RNA polymerase sigma-70 factor (ECF subfamily)
MPSEPLSQLSDDALFAEVLRLRAACEDFGRPLGELVERWRPAASFVVRKLQGSFLRGSPEDEAELFQDAVAKLIARGLDQFRGVSERLPGRSASPKTFFLRIVKHVAIDRYRKRRDDLSVTHADSQEDRLESPHEVARAVDLSRQSEDSRDATEVYWKAYARLKAEHPSEAAAWDLYHHQDVDDHEVCARKLGISVVNSYKRVSRAQAYLKLYLLELLEEQE